MGTTGLETAFAALYTELVLPGVLPLALLVERMTRGRARCSACRAADRGRRAGRTSCLIDLDARVAGRRGRLREPLGELLLRRPHVHGRVLPTVAAGAVAYRERAFARERAHERAYVLLEDGARFDGDACGAPTATRRRGRVHHRDVGLSGVRDRPDFAAPADHLHLPACRQLRRQRGGDGVRPRPRARRRHARGGRPRRTRPGRGAAGSTGCATRACPAITGIDTRALVRHIRDAGAMLGGIFPGAMRRRRRASADRGRAPDERPRPRARGDPAEPPSSPATAPARGSSRSTPASSARSSATCRARRDGSSCYPCTRLPRSCSRATPTHLPRQRPRRPGGARLLVDDVRE